MAQMARIVETGASLQVDGDWRYDPRKSILLWSVDIIDASNRTGSLEFVVPNARPEAFFPVTVNFNATRTLCQVCRHLPCLPIIICQLSLYLSGNHANVHARTRTLCCASVCTDSSKADLDTTVIWGSDK